MTSRPQAKTLRLYIGTCEGNLRLQLEALFHCPLICYFLSRWEGNMSFTEVSLAAAVSGGLQLAAHVLSKSCPTYGEGDLGTPIALDPVVVPLAQARAEPQRCIHQFHSAEC